MARVLFADSSLGVPYTYADVGGTKGFGGAETTLLRVAHELAARHEVIIAQRGREEVEIDDRGIVYCPLEEMKRLGVIDAYVATRKLHLLDWRAYFPGARVFFWTHDDWAPWPDRRLRKRTCAALARAHATPIAVSMFHQRQVERLIRPTLWNRVRGESAPPPTFVYNPTPTVLPPSEEHDVDQMIWCSSPHKGLERTLEVFGHVRRAIPSLKLVVTNPGYRDSPPLDQDGVVQLGVLSHREVLEKIRTSLCYFGMQTYPENFGIIFAECHAMGVPVLTTPIGAAPETVADQEQLVASHDVERIIERLKRWRAGGRPQVRAHSRFELPKVARDWEMVLKLVA